MIRKTSFNAIKEAVESGQRLTIQQGKALLDYAIMQSERGERLRAYADTLIGIREENQQLGQLVTGLLQRDEHVDPRPSLTIPCPCACGATIIKQYYFDPATFEIILPDTKATITGTVVEVNIHDIAFIGGKLVCRRCHADVKR